MSGAVQLGLTPMPPRVMGSRYLGSTPSNTTQPMPDFQPQTKDRRSEEKITLTMSSTPDIMDYGGDKWFEPGQLIFSVTDRNQQFHENYLPRLYTISMLNWSLKRPRDGIVNGRQSLMGQLFSEAYGFDQTHLNDPDFEVPHLLNNIKFAGVVEGSNKITSGLGPTGRIRSKDAVLFSVTKIGTVHGVYNCWNSTDSFETLELMLVCYTVNGHNVYQYLPYCASALEKGMLADMSAHPTMRVMARIPVALTKALKGQEQRIERNSTITNEWAMGNDNVRPKLSEIPLIDIHLGTF